ncbi:nuclear transport factor 2 family protein [Mesorhizobium sp. M6A.T.Cr.TU.017.01.1.1]|uniref:nuclear transport factor 2 family protein n=1 Tax=Mesorhizobium sp. M6A.T.Cr.TU.017.01.1.1 TaxID=2496774 RepID=UPI0013E385B4|nr:nuclear transport factor 2 family protein [Mesorhizobium sp. M6A.T.Cr.TU.017.01.1.1]
MTLSLQEISDRLEIEQLLIRYCYAVDDRDWEAYRNVFTPDAVLDDTVTGGIRSGVEEHIAFMKGALSKILISQHAISTILLEVRGDEASARVHCSSAKAKGRSSSKGSGIAIASCARPRVGASANSSRKDIGLTIYRKGSRSDLRGGL